MVCLLFHDFILIEKPHGILFILYIYLSHTEGKLLIKIVINKSIIKYTSFPYAVIKNETYIFDGEKVKYFLKICMVVCFIWMFVCLFVGFTRGSRERWHEGTVCFFCLSLSLSTTFQSCGQGLFFMWNANIWKNRIKMFKINGDRSLMK